MPNENTLPRIRPSRRIQLLRTFRDVFFPSKKDITQAALSPCEITVAMAAPFTPHMQAEDKDRIQHDISHRADQHGKHGDPGLTLADDKGVKAQRQLHKKCAQQIDRQIVHGIPYGGVTGSEHIQQRSLKRIEKCHQRHRTKHKEAYAVAQNLFRMFPVPFAQPDGRQRRGAIADKSRECRDKYRDTEGHAYPRQGIGAHPFHVADIDPVDNTV